MQFTCPQCNKTLNTTHIKADANIVVCDKCHAVFSPPDDDPAVTIKQNQKIPVPPSRFNIHQTDAIISISYTDIASNWLLATLMTVVSIGGFVFAFLTYQNATTRYAPNETFNLVEFLIPLLLVVWLVINVASVIMTIRILFDQVTIEIDKDALKITHRPIPIPSQQSIGTKEISQLFVKEDHHNKRRTYNVNVKTHYGKVEPLLSGFRQADHARYIEYALEQFLRIRDRLVEDEYVPSQN